MRRLGFAFLLLSMAAVPALADEAWICSWPGEAGERQLEMRRFYVAGESLIEEHILGLAHRIVHNGETGIVAAWSSQAASPTQPAGASLVMIDKAALTFKRTEISFSDRGDRAVLGSCMVDQQIAAEVGR